MIAAAIGSASSKLSSTPVTRCGLIPILSARRCLRAACGRVAAACMDRAMAAEGLIRSIFFPLRPVVNRVWLIGHPKRLFRGNPIGGMRPTAPLAARHAVRSLSVRVRPLSPPSAQLKPSLVRKAPIAVTLQRHSLSTSEFREFGEREDKQLAVFANHGHRIGLFRDGTDDRYTRPRSQVDQLLAPAGLGESRLPSGHKAFS